MISEDPSKTAWYLSNLFRLSSVFDPCFHPWLNILWISRKLARTGYERLLSSHRPQIFHDAGPTNSSGSRRSHAKLTVSLLHPWVRPAIRGFNNSWFGCVSQIKETEQAKLFPLCFLRCLLFKFPVAKISDHRNHPRHRHPAPQSPHEATSLLQLPTVSSMATPFVILSCATSTNDSSRPFSLCNRMVEYESSARALFASLSISCR